jgi:hypothetical protein
MIDKIKELAQQVESDFKMGGLAEGLYLDFATEVAKRYYGFILQSDIERLEKTKLPYLSTLCQNRNGIEYCGTCEQAWEYCSCLARNTGYKKAIDSEISLKRQAIEELKK